MNVDDTARIELEPHPAPMNELEVPDWLAEPDLWLQRNDGEGQFAMAEETEDLLELDEDGLHAYERLSETYERELLDLSTLQDLTLTLSEWTYIDTV